MTPNANYRRWQLIARALAVAAEHARAQRVKEAERQLHNARAAARGAEFRPGGGSHRPLPAGHQPLAHPACAAHAPGRHRTTARGRRDRPPPRLARGPP